jgi:hypothetical protein
MPADPYRGMPGESSATTTATSAPPEVSITVESRLDDQSGRYDANTLRSSIVVPR